MNKELREQVEKLIILPMVMHTAAGLNLVNTSDSDSKNLTKYSKLQRKSIDDAINAILAFFEAEMKRVDAYASLLELSRSTVVVQPMFEHSPEFEIAWYAHCDDRATKLRSEGKEQDNATK